METGTWFQIVKIRLKSFNLNSTRLEFNIIGDVNNEKRILNVPSETMKRLYRFVCQDRIYDGGPGLLSDDERHTIMALIKVSHSTEPSTWYTLINFGRSPEIKDVVITDATRFLLHP